MHIDRIILLELLASLLTTSATKSDIIVNVTTVSKISLKSFENLLKVSFGESKCCDVLTSGKSAAIEVLFDQFVRTYPKGYTLKGMNYECDSYLVISASDGEELTSVIRNIPSRRSTSELLIIIDGNAEESSGLFDVSLYKDANVNIAAPNGLWSLSENFLKPRNFKRVTSIREMHRKRGIVNLQGRELRAMAYWNPPFCYLESTVNRTVMGIEEEYFVATNKSELDGVEVKLFLLIAEQLNFSWTIRNPKRNDRFGHENGTTWIGGMLGQVMNDRADFAFSSMWLTMDKYRYANTTKPWAMVYIHFLVPRPKPYTSFWALTRPFSLEVWFAITAGVILQSVYVYARAWLTPDTQKRFRSFAITWTELLGRLVGSWAPSRMQGFELYFQLWHFIGILLVTAYSSSLSSRLTNSHYEKRIDSLQDFVEANLSWGWEGEIPSFSTVLDYSDPYAREIAKRYRQQFSEDAIRREILRGNYAVLGNIIDSHFFPKRISARIVDFSDLRVMKAALAEFHTTFVVQPWLLQSVDTVILRMHEAGLVNYHLQDVLHRKTGSILREVGIEHDAYQDGPRVLQLNPLGAAFVVLAMGLSISTAVFYFELKQKSTRNENNWQTSSKNCETRILRKWKYEE